MKSFLEEYGFAILAAIIVIVLIMMVSPVGVAIRGSIDSVVLKFTGVADNGLDSATGNFGKLLNNIQEEPVKTLNYNKEDEYLFVYHLTTGQFDNGTKICQSVYDSYDQVVTRSCESPYFKTIDGETHRVSYIYPDDVEYGKTYDIYEKEIPNVEHNVLYKFQGEMGTIYGYRVLNGNIDSLITFKKNNGEFKATGIEPYGEEIFMFFDSVSVINRDFILPDIDEPDSVSIGDYASGMRYVDSIDMKSGQYRVCPLGLDDAPVIEAPPGAIAYLETDNCDYYNEAPTWNRLGYWIFSKRMY